MTLISAPRTRALLRLWLKDQPEVTDICGQEIHFKLPASKVWPAMTVERVGGGPLYGHGNFVHRQLFQFKCYATPTTVDTASHLAETAIAVMSTGLNGPISAGALSAVVSDVDIGDVHEGFDPTDNDRPVCRFDAVLTVHPSRVTGS